MTKLPACRDGFTHFLLQNCPKQFETMREYAWFAGMSEQTLYGIDKRGFNSLDKMLEFSVAFQIDTELARQRISEEIAKRLSEKPHTKKP